MPEDKIDTIALDASPVSSYENEEISARAGSYSSRSWHLPALVVVALLLRFAPLLLIDGTQRMIDPNTDSVGYIGLADGLRHGCGFTLTKNRKCAPLSSSEIKVALQSVGTFAELDRTPGYPVFLWLMHDLRVALVVQALLCGTIVFIVGAFVSARWSPRAGLVAGALIALDVPSIVYSNEIMSETLFTFLFVSGVLSALCAACRRSSTRQKLFYITLSSFLFATAILVRPVGEYAFLPVALIPLTLTGMPWTKRIGLLILMVSIPIIAVAGWSLRNYRPAGVASYAPAAAKNLFYYRAAGTLAFSSGHPGELQFLRSDQTSLSRQAFQIIASHPWSFARMTAWDFFYLCILPDISPLKHLLGIQKTFPWWSHPGRCEPLAPFLRFALHRSKRCGAFIALNSIRPQYC